MGLDPTRVGLAASAAMFTELAMLRQTERCPISSGKPSLRGSETFVPRKGLSETL